MLTTVREAAFAEDLPATVVSCLHEVVGADQITYDVFRPEGAWNLADPPAGADIAEAWALFGNQHPSLPLCVGNPTPAGGPAVGCDHPAAAARAGALGLTSSSRSACVTS